MARTQWYKEMAVYQIWPRSFCDGNGDGIGDLWGVLSKLDYIKSLGVDAIWFSPLYPSPNADFGYDISDYKNIHPDYGDLELFKQVLEGAHARGLRVFMDLVVNHSSDEHPWFLESKKGRDNPYHDYYIWRPGKTVRGKRKPPNNWTSLFEGGAWEYDEGLDEYYLHLFAKKQPDLNMANPQVRREVKDILRFWLDLGVDGFREDVVTFIAKAEGLPDSFPPIPMANGMKYYSNLPAVHDYLREFKREVLDAYDCFTVGESPMTTPETALRYVTEGEEQVLDEMIGFSHMEADCLATDMIRRPFSLRKMKKAFSDWQQKLQGKAWPALYIENHDHPRIISRYGSEKYRVESGKMLAAMYLLQRGTPFIYQGQEIGMTNLRLPQVEQYPDVMTRNNVRLLSKFLPKKQVLRAVQEGARDNARTPMQWSAEPNAGFTAGTPWFTVNENYKTVNAAAQEEDPNSLLNFYRRLLRFRKEHPVAIWGDYVELLPEDKHLYVYERNYAGCKLLVICSFTDEQIRFQAPTGIELSEKALVFANYEWNFVISNGFTTRPYELRVYLFETQTAENSEFGMRNSELEDAKTPSASVGDGVLDVPLSDEPAPSVGDGAPDVPQDNSEFGIRNAELEDAKTPSASVGDGAPDVLPIPDASVGDGAPDVPPTPDVPLSDEPAPSVGDGAPDVPPTPDAPAPDESVGAIHESPAPAEEDPSTRPEGLAQDDSAPPAPASEEDAP